MAVLRCLAPFALTEKSGVERVVSAGDLVDSTDPVVKGREDLFEPVETTVARTKERGVEKATASPGEKRTAAKPAKSD
jgi:hypothetical protein